MIKNVLLDIDGVFLYGNDFIGGGKETLKFLEKKKYNYLFVSNITRLTAKELSQKFKKTGIKTKVEHIFTPPEAIADYIKSKKQNATCFLIASPSSKKEFKKSGLKISEKEKKVDYVVVFLYEKTDYKILNRAFVFLENGAKLVSNTNQKVAPLGKNGEPALATGPIVKLLEYASGKTATIVGKPQKEFFDAALYKLNAKASETLIVGDSIETDILGAKNSGIKSVLVKTGNFKQEDLDKSNIKPDYVIESIKDLPRLLEEICNG